MMSSEFKYSHLAQAFMLTPQTLKAELEAPGMALALLMEMRLCAGQQVAMCCSLGQPCDLCRQVVELLEHAKLEGQRKCLHDISVLKGHGPANGAPNCYVHQMTPPRDVRLLSICVATNGIYLARICRTQHKGVSLLLSSPNMQG